VGAVAATSRTETGVDDATLATLLAQEAGRALNSLRRQAFSPTTSLQRAADALAERVIAGALSVHRPRDCVLSEEAADDVTRLSRDRVWIVDPLDGTREYAETGRTDWAVHVALWENGDLVCGAVAQPALNRIVGSAPPAIVSRRRAGPVRLLVSRSRPPAFAEAVAGVLAAELVPMGSAGAKAMAVLLDGLDGYVHAGGQYEWDSAAPVAVCRAAGLHCSRIDGSPLRYNRADPYLPDLVVCRPELARPLLTAIAGSAVLL
jgi:3'(2'), 5'-bisphosphate nucleotidase